MQSTTLKYKRNKKSARKIFAKYVTVKEKINHLIEKEKKSQGIGVVNPQEEMQMANEHLKGHSALQ